MRFLALIIVLLGVALFLVLGAVVATRYYWAMVVLVPLAFVGLYDVVQTRHSITRNYPIMAHFRFLLEAIRPEMHQYFVESDIDGRPFSRDERSLVYERSKDIEGLKPFGTELDVYSEEYEWCMHSIAPRPKSKEHFRTLVGGPDCT